LAVPNTSSRAPLLTVVALAVAPEATSSSPPLATMVPLAEPRGFRRR
jgi:hypothetical protein